MRLVQAVVMALYVRSKAVPAWALLLLGWVSVRLVAGRRVNRIGAGRSDEQVRL